MILYYAPLLPVYRYYRYLSYVINPNYAVGLGFDARPGLPEDVSGKSNELESELGTHT